MFTIASNEANGTVRTAKNTVYRSAAFCHKCLKDQARRSVLEFASSFDALLHDVAYFSAYFSFLTRYTYDWNRYFSRRPHNSIGAN